MKAKEIKSHPVAGKKAATITEKPLLERNKAADKKGHKKTAAKSEAMHDAHTVYGVADHDQVAVNRLRHTDPDLWHRIRSWN